MSSRNAHRSLLRGNISKRRDYKQLIFDAFTNDSTAQIALANHTSDVGQPDSGGPCWVTHPASASTINVLPGDSLSNVSGSAVSLSRHLLDPVSADYTVSAAIKATGTTLTSFQGGNRWAVCARMDPSNDTYYMASIQVNGSGAVGTIITNLYKVVGGTTTVLGSYNFAVNTSTPPPVNSIWKLILSVSNDEKVLYVQGPDDAFPVRRVSSGDNTIPAPGFAGLSVLRCSNGAPWTLDSYEVRVSGPQPQSGTLIGSSPDPVQAPALLFEPDYSVATPTVGTGQPASSTGGLVAGKIWRTEQEPYVRGVRQTNRIEIIDASQVPGSGTYKPAQGCLHITLNSFYASSITVTATADATASATQIFVDSPLALNDKDFLDSKATGDTMRVVGTPTGNPVTVVRESTPDIITTGDVFQVPGGDVSDSGSSFQASRAEVYDRFPAGGGTTAAAQWPDPVGSIRWYGLSIYIPTSFTISDSLWFTMMQWKGQYGGSPPRALEIDGDRFILGGTRTRRDLGSIARGTWTRLVFGYRFETSGINGWVTVYRDGVNIVPKRYEATMDKKSDGSPDPIYLKDGIYRTKNWTATHEIFLGPTRVGTTMADVA